jgi:hypothetical protein
MRDAATSSIITARVPTERIAGFDVYGRAGRPDLGDHDDGFDYYSNDGIGGAVRQRPPVRRPRRERQKSRAAVEPATLFMRSRWVLMAVENGTSDRMVWPYFRPAAGDDDHRCLAIIAD